MQTTDENLGSPMAAQMSMSPTFAGEKQSGKKSKAAAADEFTSSAIMASNQTIDHVVKTGVVESSNNSSTVSLTKTSKTSQI